jgi:hypothetical protein
VFRFLELGACKQAILDRSELVPVVQRKGEIHIRRATAGLQAVNVFKKNDPRHRADQEDRKPKLS